MDKHFNQTKDDRSAYKAPTFENDQKLIDWSKEEFNEPRALTIKNIRDIFFALMNQSQAQQRICDSEDNIRRLWDKCE